MDREYRLGETPEAQDASARLKSKVSESLVDHLDKEHARRWAGFIGRVHVVNVLAVGYALALIPAVIGFVVWRDGISTQAPWGAVAVIFAGLSLFGAYVSSSVAALYPGQEGWHKASGVLCCLAAFIAWLCILSAFLS